MAQDKAGTKRKADTIDKNDGSSKTADSSQAATPSAQDRKAQFRALKMRAKDSKKENRHALYAEHTRLKSDPRAQKQLEQKKSLAAEKLAKLDATEAGQDYSRKRAWDYSIAESQDWDTKVQTREENRLLAGETDYAAAAAAQYIKATAHLTPDLDAYKEQQEALQLVLGAPGQVMAADGSMVSKAHTQAELNHVGFIHQKANKEGIDRLLANLSRVDAAKVKAQIKRGKRQGDDGDYINDQNKIFNAKVARHYDKYTKDMRDSFERGTAQ